MAFEVPMDDIESSTIGGFDRVAPGSYHMTVTDVNEDGGTKGEMIVKFDIMRGTVDGQQGKEFQCYFSKEMNKVARRRVHAFAIATGLITSDQLEQHKKAGTSPSYDFNKVVGRQVCANLEDNFYNDKHTTRLAWDEIFHPADKRASHVPLLMARIKMANPPIVLPEGRNPDGAVRSSDGEKKKSTGSSKANAPSVDDLLP